MREYLAPGRFIDSDHPLVVEFAEHNRGQSAVLRDQAVSLCYAQGSRWLKRANHKAPR